MGRSNSDTKHRKCSFSSFSTYTCHIRWWRFTENSEALHGFVPPSTGQPAERDMRKPAASPIFRFVLWKLTYGVLSFLSVVWRPFRYRRRHWVKSYPICRLFSSWADQFPLVPAHTSGSDKTLDLAQVQGFSSKKPWRLQNFRRHNLEQSQTGVSVSGWRDAGLGLSPWAPAVHPSRIWWGGSSRGVWPYSILSWRTQALDQDSDGTTREGAR